MVLIVLFSFIAFVVAMTSAGDIDAIDSAWEQRMDDTVTSLDLIVFVSVGVLLCVLFTTRQAMNDQKWHAIVTSGAVLLLAALRMLITLLAG